MPIQSCSCQLSVFSIYEDKFTMTVQLKETKTGQIRIQISSSERCMISTVTPEHPASFEISEILYNGYEITEVFLVDFSSSENYTSCEKIDETAEERRVYLVNKTKEEIEGSYQYIINLPKISIAITQFIVFLLLLILTHNIKYRKFTPWQFNFIFALIYAIFLFLTVYIEAYIDDSLKITFWLVMAFALVCSCIYFIDILSIFFTHRVTIIGLALILSFLLGVI